MHTQVRAMNPNSCYNVMLAPRFTYSTEDNAISFWVGAMCTICGYEFLGVNGMQDLIWDVDIHWKENPKCNVGQHAGNKTPPDSWVKPAWNKFMNNLKKNIKKGK